jgi:hypothetical protein
MPQGKGTYGSKVGRPKKKKYQGGREVDYSEIYRKDHQKMMDERPIPLEPKMPLNTSARRDSIFQDGRFITTNPETGLLESGPDPMTEENRIKAMAIQNKKRDAEEYWNKLKKDDVGLEEKVDDVATPVAPPDKDHRGDPTERHIFRKEERPAGPGYRKGGVLRRGGSTKSSNVLRNGGSVSKRGGSIGRNGIL